MNKTFSVLVLLSFFILSCSEKKYPELRLIITSLTQTTELAVLENKISCDIPTSKGVLRFTYYSLDGKLNLIICTKEGKLLNSEIMNPGEVKAFPDHDNLQVKTEILERQ
jgi:hypothetical protein